MKMEQSVPKRQHIKFRQPGNYPEENIKHTAHGESLKSQEYCNFMPASFMWYK